MEILKWYIHFFDVKILIIENDSVICDIVINIDLGLLILNMGKSVCIVVMVDVVGDGYR